jgi:hypothetical protein
MCASVDRKTVALVINLISDDVPCDRSFIAEQDIAWADYGMIREALYASIYISIVDG